MVPTERANNDGLLKRCTCTRDRWVRCKHPWHLQHMRETVHYRFPLWRYARVPRETVMTKTEAEGHQRKAIEDIHAGKLTTNGRRLVQEVQGATVGQGFDAYVADWVNVPKRGERARAAITRLLKTARTIEVPTGKDSKLIRFEDKAIVAVTKADIDAIRDERRRVVKTILKARKRVAALFEAGTPIPAELVALSASAPNLGDGEHAGETGIDRLLSRLRHAFNWLVQNDYIEKSPFLKGSVALVKMANVDKPRRRRLRDGEEDALRQFASPRLNDLMTGALESCMREGELFAMQWTDVDLVRREIFVAAIQEGARKTDKGRHVAISDALYTVLKRRQSSPDGRPFKAKHYVFGDDAGRQVKSLTTAWENCVLKAHGHDVERNPRTHALLPSSQAALRAIDLHFHDLRREGGSRLLESGWDLHAIQKMLGHTTLAQTSTYLDADRILLQRNMRRAGTVEAVA